MAALVTFRLVENPLRRSRVLRPGRRSLALWPVAIAAVALAVVASEREATTLLEARMAGATVDTSTAIGPAPEATPSSRARPGNDSQQRSTTARPSLEDRLAEALRAADSAAPVPFPLINLPGIPEDAFRLPPDCVVDPEETSTKVCPIGHPQGEHTVVVLGDSQAGQWIPAIDLLGHDQRWRVLPLIKLGCSPFDVPSVDGGGANYWQCEEFRAWAAEYITRARPELVIVGSEATSYRLRPAAGLTLEQTWSSGVTGLLERLRGQGARVVVLADTPDFAFDPVDCLTAPGSTLDSCVGAPHAGLAEANAATRETADRLGVAFMDTPALLCLHGRCPLVVDRTMTFMDYSHVSAAWSAALADEFARLYRMAVTDLEDQAS